MKPVLDKEKMAEQSNGETNNTQFATKDAKEVLENWMYEHRYYCYPTKQQKRELSIQTGLNISKISNWFVNSRRRILPKILDNEGKNVKKFTIVRGQKKNKKSSTINEWMRNMETKNSSFEKYAEQEERKIADHIFSEFECQTTETNCASIPIQEETHQAPQMLESSLPLCATRGLLYDEANDTKCMFIIIN